MRQGGNWGLQLQSVPVSVALPLGNVQVSVLPPFSAQKHFWGAQRRVRLTPGAEANPEDIAEE